jgi:hypothetical protein
LRGWRPEPVDHGAKRDTRLGGEGVEPLAYRLTI